jgi:PIN domain nuclease of toxin-antitoxin system
MIVLDTHILIWWIDSPQKLSKTARKIIEEHTRKEKGILVSSISTFEICLLVKKGKLVLTILPDVWLGKIENLPFVQFIPVDNSIAASSVSLPEFPHKDPADRMIIATALHLGAKLVTSDVKIRTYKHIQTIW